MRYLLISLFMLGAISLCSQNILLLEKLGAKRRFFYKERDTIRLAMKKRDFYTSEAIIQITDSFLFVKGYNKIHLDQISGIERVYKNRKRNGLLVMIAGGALIAITAINNAMHDKPVLDPVFVSIGAGLVIVGGAWFSQFRKRYKTGSKWKIKSLNYNY